MKLIHIDYNWSKREQNTYIRPIFLTLIIVLNYLFEKSYNDKVNAAVQTVTVRSSVYVRYVEGHHRHFKMTLKNSERRF